MTGYPTFAPGGMLQPPAPSPTPMLNVQVQPRHSIYVSGEGTGAFIVDAGLSLIHGSPYTTSTTSLFASLAFDIRESGNDDLLVSNTIRVNTTGVLFEFDLTLLSPRPDPYAIVLYGSSMDGSQSYSATTELYDLRDKTIGSVVKIDNLYGGLLYKNNATNNKFTSVLPYGFYTDCSTYLNESLSNVDAYAAMGLNAINPVCAFTDGNLNATIDEMDKINLLFQYDMRGSFQNLSSVAAQIPLVKDHPSFLSYYTADEPDGWEYALNSTKLAYDLIASLDKYHPVGLVLNCANFYFAQYVSGCDYIMEDAYPVGINATWSRPYDTPCTPDYGDCGCDDCAGSLLDVPHRIDAFYAYQDWLGSAPVKPVWAVTQSFSGEGYWSRDPTAAETWVMNLLALNHGAKGVMAWAYPTTDVLAAASGQMGKVVMASPVVEFLLGAKATAVPVRGHPLVDAAYWVVGSQMMVSVASAEYVAINGTVEIGLPVAVSGIVSQPWGGDVDWAVGNATLRANGLAALKTSIVILAL